MQIITSADLAIAELLGCLMELLLGCWLLFPMASQHQVWWTIHHSFPPRGLAIAMLAIGMEQLLALCSNKWQWRRAGAYCSVALWAFITSLLGHDMTNPMFPVSMLCVVSALLGGIRLRLHLRDYHRESYT